MSFGLVIEPEAEAEIAQASDWYEQQATALRIRFLHALNATFDQIKFNPYQYQVVFGQLRQVMLKGFRYTLIYVVEDHDVIVVSCFHTSRNPDHWQRRSR